MAAPLGSYLVGVPIYFWLIGVSWGAGAGTTGAAGGAGGVGFPQMSNAKDAAMPTTNTLLSASKSPGDV